MELFCISLRESSNFLIVYSVSYSYSGGIDIIIAFKNSQYTIHSAFCCFCFFYIVYEVSVCFFFDPYPFPFGFEFPSFWFLYRMLWICVLKLLSYNYNTHVLCLFSIMIFSIFSWATASATQASRHRP